MKTISRTTGKPILTKRQFRRQHPAKSDAEIALLWQEYLTLHGIEHGRLTGDALVAAQAAAAAGIARRRREAAKADRFWAERDAIHEALLTAGWALAKESDSGSRYYQRGDDHVRVSDHPPTDATAQWMERVGCVSVNSVDAAQVFCGVSLSNKKERGS